MASSGAGRRRVRLMSAATPLVELGIVMEARLGAANALAVERFLATAGRRRGRRPAPGRPCIGTGWRRFGKGRHEAALNLGDCFMRVGCRPRRAVLCTGNGFDKTDLARALARRSAVVDELRFGIIGTGMMGLDTSPTWPGCPARRRRSTIPMRPSP